MLNKSDKKKGAFTLIELLVVIAIIALLMSVIMPALGKAKEMAQRVICRNNLRQQSLGITLYANDNDTAVPENNMGGWLWDMTFLATNQLSEYAGFDDNETFFCPGNRIKKAEDARFWQYSYLYPGPYPNPVQIADETVPPISNNLNGYYRVLPYIYMFDKGYIDSSTGQWVSFLPDTLRTGKEANWIRKLSNVKASGSKIMAMDAIISDGTGAKFEELLNGGIDTLSDGNLTDNTNHLSRRKTAGGWSLPSGANASYADGHAEWIPAGSFFDATNEFENIKFQVQTGPMRFYW